MPDAIPARLRPAFRAFATTVVPQMAELDDAAWREVEATVEYALRHRPPRLRRQLQLLLRMLETLPKLRYGRPFSTLDAARRTRVVEALQAAPLKLLRRGIWGLRTLVLMGHYTRADVATQIGYRADRGGWAARAATNGGER